MHGKTIFCDIDGCVLEHWNLGISTILRKTPVLLSKVRDTFDDWEAGGYYVVLVTARPESMRNETEKVLRSFGLSWGQLVMGLPNGSRILINDIKPHKPNKPTAVAYNVERNVGLGYYSVTNLERDEQNLFISDSTCNSPIVDYTVEEEKPFIQKRLRKILGDCGCGSQDVYVYQINKSNMRFCASCLEQLGAAIAVNLSGR